jgi:fumarylacetoacetate (FAA) hydrolase family protein
MTDSGWRAARRCAKISRDPSDIAAQTIGANHDYPDGAALFLGTMYAPSPTATRPARASPTRPGDVVAVSADKLGRLVNRMRHAHECPRWTFGAGALMRNLARRGLDLER